MERQKERQALFYILEHLCRVKDVHKYFNENMPIDYNLRQLQKLIICIVAKDIYILFQNFVFELQQCVERAIFNLIGKMSLFC